MAAEVHGFQTEVAKLLDLLTNSLYSNKEVFLRELISNASDALDKLHFMALTDAKKLEGDPDLKIRIRADKEAGTLTIADNGIGMTLEEANDHLGTIAKSGTADFFKTLSGDAAKDSQLIGQFGVGFYSAFIVADSVTVLSRSVNAKANEGVRWTSKGEGTFESETIEHPARGTEVILHLKDSAKDYLETWTLREAITKYSDHIAMPVYLYEEQYDAEEKDDKKKKEPKFEYKQVNDAKALWTKTPKDVKDEEYKEFYKHLTHDYEEPMTWSHNRVEGDMEYTSLLYIPKNAPWDLYSREEQHGLKLFVQRVFIMDKAESFLPNYLRFLRGLVDTNDLPLNVSRELLQESAVTTKLKKALTKRALSMIEKLAADKEKYAAFWTTFGRVMKEGPIEDYTNREEVAKLLRFASTDKGTAEQCVSLPDYVSRMKEKQTKIYYLVSASFESAASSPYLETFKKKGIEVLLLSERIDEWLMGNMHEFDGKEFVSVTSSDLKLGDLEDKETVEKAPEENKKENDAVARFKAALGETVKNVIITHRLTETASCVTAEEGQIITAQMRHMLEAAGQKVPEPVYTLEINPDHALVKKAVAELDADRFKEWATLLYEQALLSEQGTLKDPNAFIRRMNTLVLN